jgi:hypothetical protein
MPPDKLWDMSGGVNLSDLRRALHFIRIILVMYLIALKLR